MKLESFLDTVARILFWVLVHIIAPLVLVGIYIVLANVGDVGYLILFSTIVITLYHVLLSFRGIFGKMKKFQVPASVDLTPLEAALTDHAAKFHPEEVEWKALKTHLPNDLTRRLEALEQFMRLIEGLDLAAKLADIGRRLTTIEQKPAPAAVDLAPLEHRLADLEGKPPPAAVDLTGIEARIAVLEGKPAPAAVNLTEIEARLAALEQEPAPAPVDLALIEARLAAFEAKPDLEPRVAAEEQGSTQLANAIAALQKAMQDVHAEIAALKQPAAKKGGK